MAPSRRRIALVVGNEDYLGPGIPRLVNAVYDAAAVRDALVAAGFSVTLATNLSLPQFSDAVDSFVRALTPESVALFYYSGHAIQVQNQNLMIPVDFKITDEAGALAGAFSASAVHQGMVNSGARPQILILDACQEKFESERNEWFKRLTRMPLARNSFVAFATEEGRVALEDLTPGVHSRFTRHLLEGLRTQGAEIREIFRSIKQRVKADSDGLQIPWVEEHLLEDFYFYPPRTRWNARDGLDYVLIPGGTFLMGCVPSDTECAADEKPRHVVDQSGDVWMGRTEVTVGAYRHFAAATRRDMPPPLLSINPNWRENTHPMVKVSWHDARAFCEWAGGRLPTEAEWEYVARGGAEGAVFGDAIDSAWRYTRPVEESASTGFGVLGMAENVEEWTHDWYSADYYSRSARAGPQGPPSGNEKVVRGGSWDPYAGKRRISARLGVGPGTATSSRGFRCVLRD